jgi:hypothetical protein
MQLLMPYYLDYDLLLLAVPAVLVAGEFLHQNASDPYPPADRWLIRLWGLLFVWMIVNPGMAGLTHVNLGVVLGGGMAALLVGRTLRQEKVVFAEDGRAIAVSQAQAA